MTDYPEAGEHLAVQAIPTDHYILLAVQRQVAGLVAEKAALQEQIAGLVAERDALRVALERWKQQDIVICDALRALRTGFEDATAPPTTPQPLKVVVDRMYQEITRLRNAISIARGKLARGRTAGNEPIIPALALAAEHILIEAMEQPAPAGASNQQPEPPA